MHWIFLSVLLWGLLHSWLASLGVKDWVKRVLGPLAGRLYRLTYNLFAVLSFLPVLALAWLTPDRPLYKVPLPWSGLMVLGELLALLALWVGFRQTSPLEFLGLDQLAGPDSTSPFSSHLVTAGLYKYVRHPLYSAGLVVLWLFPVMTINLLALFIGFTLYIVVGMFFEERKLVREFGEAYLEYRSVTPALIPFTRWNKRPGPSS